MEDYSKILNTMREDLEKAKDLRIRAETRMEQLNRQKQEILNEIKALGVSPDELQAEVEKLKDEINGLIHQARQMIP